MLIESRASFLIFTDHGQLWLETIDRGGLIEIPLCGSGAAETRCRPNSKLKLTPPPWSWTLGPVPSPKSGPLLAASCSLYYALEKLRLQMKDMAEDTEGTA